MIGDRTTGCKHTDGTGQSTLCSVDGGWGGLGGEMLPKRDGGDGRARTADLCIMSVKIPLVFVRFSGYLYGFRTKNGSVRWPR